jgi:transcriptional regulator with XRE-family HTH domain
MEKEQTAMIGQRIRGKRESLKLTQKQLADALGLTPQHISAIEQGKRLPSIASLAQFAEQLGVNIDYLVTGKEGTITEIIPAIKADKNLSVEVKNALVRIVQTLYETKVNIG